MGAVCPQTPEDICRTVWDQVSSKHGTGRDADGREQYDGQPLGVGRFRSPTLPDAPIDRVSVAVRGFGAYQQATSPDAL